MSRVSLSIASFIIGMVSMLALTCLLPGISLSLVHAQADLETTNSKPSSHPVISLFGLNPESIPTYAGITTNGIIKDVNLKNAQQILDGLRCTNCNFIDSELIYNGGPFDLKNTKFTGTTHLVMGGAAANTEALLRLFNGINEGKPPASDPAKTRPKRKAMNKTPQTVTFSAPFIGD